MDEVKEKIQDVKREIKKNEDAILKAERSTESELNEVLKIKFMDKENSLMDMKIKLMDKENMLRDKENKLRDELKKLRDVTVTVWIRYNKQQIRVTGSPNRGLYDFLGETLYSKLHDFSALVLRYKKEIILDMSDSATLQEFPTTPTQNLEVLSHIGK